MKVAQVMSTRVLTVKPDDYMSAAAQIMWDKDCGCVPVVDNAGKVVAMVTDRDVCMAAYTQGVPLWAITVSSAMSRNLVTIKSHDTLSDALKSMRKHRVRRLPVVDDDGKLIGLLSLMDVARESERESTSKLRSITPEEVALTLASVGVPHFQPAASVTKHSSNVAFGSTSTGGNSTITPHVVIKT